ncbi:uncharacterized protein LOC106079275 [Biomphalaria glabrata]|uniref:Uncharacterized protein LOC106079275 n=1 Tax=Biomphalaria glabrata TaxID=6526 RepID=A0A9W3BPV6_BIOGL|nr:uncharacterized protein LOC106079275 [Biomphalaria glabrata]
MGKIGWLAPVGLVLVAMWFSVDAFRYSYYISITVKKSEVSESTLGAVGGVIADWIPLSYTNTDCDQTYRLISTKSLTQQLIGTLELSCTNDNWYDYFEAIQASVYDNLVRQQYHVTVNDLDIEVLKLNVFNSSSDALQNINALELSMCFRDFSMCQPEEFCYDTTFKPVCLASCDYGQYLDNGQCVSCPFGQTTLMLSAWSIDRCVDVCTRGSYYSFQSQSCMTCPDGLYWSDADKACHLCPYTIYNATSCQNGTERQLTNARINIDLDLTLVTSSCAFNHSDELQVNGDSMSTYVTKVLTTRDYDKIYRGLCLPAVSCYNLEAKIVNNQMCIPDGSCTDETCSIYRTNLHLTLFYSWQYIQPSYWPRGVYHNRSAVDVLLESLYDWTEEARTQVFKLDMNARFELPYSPRVTVMDLATKSLYVSFKTKDVVFSMTTFIHKMHDKVLELATAEDEKISNELLMEIELRQS